MTNVVPLRGHKSGQEIEALWQAYVEAMTRAQASLVLEDGLAARRAWKEFIEAFNE
jgi:hypothetical protein